MVTPVPIELADVRLVRRARAGEPDALGLLWGQVVDPAWSIASALMGRSEAFEVIRVLRASFRGCLRSAQPESAWRAEAFRALWSLLWDGLELPPLQDISQVGWSESIRVREKRATLTAMEKQRRIRGAIQRAPRELQIIYLFDLFSQCSADQIAAFAGAPELTVRAARTALAYRITNALRS